MVAVFDRGQVISISRAKYQRYGYDCSYAMKFHGGPTIWMVVKNGPAPTYLQGATLTVESIESSDARDWQDVKIDDGSVEVTCDLKIRNSDWCPYDLIREATPKGNRYRNVDGKDDAYISMEHFYRPDNETEWVAVNGEYVRVTVKWGHAD